MPLGKTITAECEHCGFGMNEKDFPWDYAAEAATLKSEIKHPLSFYSFWLVAGIILVYNLWKKGVLTELFQ